ncbi:MAG: GNAT family N-acetyltransferase [Desulfobacterota bacterium]|nr:GNAT family N-acetyltransferase [Thermodesulfobacteriota bacterium]
MEKLRPIFYPPPYQDAAEYGRLILRDGSSATVHIAGLDDQEAFLAFTSRLSLESRYRRFFSMRLPDEKFITKLCDSSNPRERLTLIVTRIIESVPRIIATGSYVLVEPQKAEVAVVVDDAFQGKGLATLLLERLSLLAVRNGILGFQAVTHADNRRMLEIFQNSGFPLHQQTSQGLVDIELSVLPGEDSVTRSELRDRVYTTASLRPFFRPNAVAVIGASRKETSLGFMVVESLMTNRFQGPVYPVNPKAEVIYSIRASHSVRELPEQVDLAVVVVPKETVPQVVDDCAALGVRALIVITAGYAEEGAEGRRLQEALVEKVRGYGMRLVGPNCLGLMNTDPEMRLNASFSPIFPPAGRIAMSSQSGALGLAILGFTKQLDLGLSKFISIGNKADVTGNDLLQYWEGDPHTDVILLYLESFGNPRRFARIARRVSRSKPIVAVKSGRTTAGKRAAGSHTAALAASDVAVDALFHQTGVIRAETLEEMFDLAAVLGSQPLPPGRRVAIVTNAGGPGILCADTCEAEGLEVPEPSEKIRSALRAAIPRAASLGNPVDMIASATPEEYRQAIEILLSSEEVDALIVIYIPVIAETEIISRAIYQGVLAARAAGGVAKPVLACMMVGEGLTGSLKYAEETIPTFAFPESVARVLSRVAEYAEWRRLPIGMYPDFEDLKVEPVRAICQKAIQERGAGWLSGEENQKVLQAVGLPQAPGGLARTPEEAEAIAAAVGFPVAAKLSSPQIVHKTELGGVRLNLADKAAVRGAFSALEPALKHSGNLSALDGIWIQPMISGGVEIMVGVTEDPVFGPLVGFGLGGIHVEVMGDVRFRVTPLTDRDARELVGEIRGFRLLTGFRGNPPADIEALEEVLLRVSRLVEEVPEITDLDLNPIITRPPGQGCVIVDARIRVEQPGKKA